MPIKSKAEHLGSNTKHSRDEEGKSKFLDDWTKDKRAPHVPKFLRDAMAVNDINGAAPKPVRKELPSQKYSDRGTPQRAGSVPPRDPLLDRLLPSRHQRVGSGMHSTSTERPYRRPLDNSLCRADIEGSFTTPLPEFRRPSNFVHDIATRRSRSRTGVDESISRQFYGLEQLPDANKGILKFVQLSDLKNHQAKLKEREILSTAMAIDTQNAKPTGVNPPQARRDRAERLRQKQTDQSEASLRI